MIETFMQEIIKELGATGVLVMGLYFMMYRPLNSMAQHIRTINHELGEVVTLLKNNKSKIKAGTIES